MDANNSQRPKRKLPIDLDDLALAFETGPEMANSFLDLETGRVITITDDLRAEYDQVVEAIGQVDASQWQAAFEAALADGDWPEWEHELLRDIDRVEQGFPKTCLRVPHVESRDGYADMEDFIETVSNRRASDALAQAISGRHPFRAFKDVLIAFPAERERWFAFQKTLIRERILEWLDSEGIEQVTGGEPAP